MDVYFLSNLIVFIPFATGLVLFKHFNTRLRIFFAFVAYGMLNEIAAAFLVKIIGVKNNMPLGHLYGIVTFLILFVFYRLLLNGYIKKKWIDILVGFYTVYYLFNSIFLQSLFEYPGVSHAIGSIIILIFIILYFSKVMHEAKIRNLFAVTEIWISGALMIFYAGNLFFFMLFNLFLDYSVDFAMLIVDIRIALNALVYILISVGFIKQWSTKSLDWKIFK